MHSAADEVTCRYAYVKVSDHLIEVLLSVVSRLRLIWKIFGVRKHTRPCPT
jgi:hypothetical protein